MADISQTLAEMIARAKPQQAPSPGNVQVAAGGPLRSNMKEQQISASIDIGAIQNLFSMDDRKSDEAVANIAQQYSLALESGRPEDMKMANQVVDNPIVQKILGDAVKRGNPSVTTQEINTPAAPIQQDPNTGEMIQTPSTPKTRFIPLRQYLPEEARRSIAFGNLPQEQKQSEAIRATDRMKTASGLQGDEARRKQLGYELALQNAQNAGAAGAGESMGSKIALQEIKDFADYQKQYGKPEEFATDKEEINAPRIKNLQSRAMQHLENMKLGTGDPAAGEGAIDSVILYTRGELKKPLTGTPEQKQRWVDYTENLASLLKKSGSTNSEYYIELMNWAAKTKNESEMKNYMLENFPGLFVNKGKYTEDRYNAILGQTSAYKDQIRKQRAEEIAKKSGELELKEKERISKKADERITDEPFWKKPFIRKAAEEKIKKEEVAMQKYKGQSVLVKGAKK